MKAIVSKRYGRPSELQLQEIDVPIPGDKEVLVKIKATTINDWDWSLARGRPYVYRLIYGLFRPKKPVFGVEIAGIVETLGAGATHFVPGDKVYGDISLVGYGGWAEYAAVPETALMKMPGQIDFEAAVALPHACALACQGLIDEGKIEKGNTLLINGGGGGVGTLGVQIARNLGAVKIIGVDSEEKFPTMQRLGFDEVLDYRKTDFTKINQQYDLVLDTKTTRSPLAYLKVLKPRGKYVTVGGSPMRIIQLLIFKMLISLFSNKRLILVALQPNKSLESLASWIEEGKLEVVIDGPYSLED
ncbi:MAG: NAD(P)-dependent alcohol dehydrogenase, partial [Flavobacteriaceae bacterium]